MRLPEFITASTEPILAEWESFARSIWPGNAVATPDELRDHAEAILQAIVRDMGTAQTQHQQAEKSKGHGDRQDESRLLTASDEHGSERVESGFDLRLVMAEYRALRASVLRLWRASRPEPDVRDLDNITRFNESIDQSLARAVSSFTARIDRSRQMFLAILGHDLRNPLAAIKVSAQVGRMATEDPAYVSRLDGILTSADVMVRMIADLLDFASTGLGGTIPVHTAHVDLARICREVASEARAAHPEATIHLEADDDCTGTWDPHRLRQVVSNLLGNALQHGDAGQPIELRVECDQEHARLAITNHGEPIPAGELATIFEPLVGGDASRRNTHHRTGSIGLGLYIARAIVVAHGGTLGVESSAHAGTRFTARLPRNK